MCVKIISYLQAKTVGHLRGCRITFCEVLAITVAKAHYSWCVLLYLGTANCYQNPATLEAEAGISEVQGQPGQFLETLSQEIRRAGNAVV